MKPPRKSTKGLSFLVAIGSWGGIYIYAKTTHFRVCIGFVAFTIFFFDLENAFENQDTNKK